MPFVPVAAPVPLPVAGPFAALTIDAQRRRVFAAGARALAVIDADTGKLLATIRLDGALSLAVEPLGGHVFAGTRDGRIAEVDPDRKTLVRSVAAGGPVSLLLYDATTGRLSAGAGGPRFATIDARTFAPVGDVPLPDVPSGAAADPVTGDVYVTFAGRDEVAVVTPSSGSVRTAFPLGPGAAGAGVRFDDALGEIAVARVGGAIGVYDRAGTPLGEVAVPGGTAACDLDTGDHLLACTGSGGLTFVRLSPGGAPRVAGNVPEPGPARAVLDAQTHDAVVVTAGADGRAAVVTRIETAPSAP
jgi:DNA-binding beta-propeller fold protein YncE